MSAIFIAITTVGTLGLIFGIILGCIFQHFKIKKDPIVEKIYNLLPQIQCGQCGYPGCLPYAEAIGTQNEKIDLCYPGGKTVIQEVSELLNIEPQFINCNKNTQDQVSMLAVIDEMNCIGCNKCVQVCPVDAIIGAKKFMHTVIADLCTGCSLCISPCPMQCIKLIPIHK